MASALLLVVVTVCSHAQAADEEFVGMLAVVADDAVAEKLGLSKSEHEALLDLIDERETDALDMALRMRDLEPAERAQKLAPFRKTSEQLGLKRLTESQREMLQGIWFGRQGMSALSDPMLAKRMKLSKTQQTQVRELIAQRKAAISKLGGLDAKKAHANYERQLKAVLDPAQLVAWNSLTNPTAPTGSAGIKKGLKSKQNLAKESRLNRENRLTKKRRWIGEGGEDTGDNSNNGTGKLQFSFQYAQWGEVIRWFADEADLSLIMETPPQGSLNYTDTREYTPSQAIDLLNSVLLIKGYTLVRRDQMLVVVNLEDGIPPNLITEVAADELDDRGEYELVKCLFTLRGVNAEEAAEEIGNLVGPQGKVDVLASSNQLQITETAGRLRTFRKILDAGERKGNANLGSAKLIQLKHVRSNEVISAWRKLMGLSDEENISADGSIRVAKGKTSKQLLVSGEDHRVSEIQDLVNLLDVPVGGGSLLNTPQLVVYPLADADPESVLAVMLELFSDVDEIRLSTDASTRSLVALATPQEHAMIRTTVQQLQADPRQVEVIRLRTVDPQLAMLSIEKLFGIGEAGEDETPDPNAPRVDADPISRSLLIRASEAQIADIRSLLVKMGEQEPSADGSDRSLTSGRGNLRMIPIDAATARRAMEQMGRIWPTVRKNRIRTVRPSSSIREGGRPGTDVSVPEAPMPGGAESQRGNPVDPTDVDIDNSVRFKQTKPIHATRYVHQIETVDAEVSGEPSLGSDANLALIEEQVGEPARNEEALPEVELPEVIVTMGEQGLLIASEDTEALDEFEELFMTLANSMFSGSREMAIFYLKYAKADVATEMLKQFISGGTSSSGGGGTTLLGSLAGAALGNSGIGSMLGLGGGGSSGSARISSGTTVIADPRLNAVIVQATPKELDFIEDLLKVLDKSNSPERIETVPRPRAIPVVNTDAEAVADVVRSVYSTRLAGGGSAQSGRQPSPEEFIRAMTGQKNTSKSISNSIQDQVRVNISVDKRRNALLVVAPESLFQEIKELVAELDFATPELSETIRYGRAAGSSPDIIRSAIATIMNEAQPESNEAQKPKTSVKKSNGESPQRAPGMEEMKRRMDFFKAMQNRAAKQNAAKKKSAALQKSGRKK